MWQYLRCASLKCCRDVILLPFDSCNLVFLQVEWAHSICDVLACHVPGPEQGTGSMELNEVLPLPLKSPPLSAGAWLPSVIQWNAGVVSQKLWESRWERVILNGGERHQTMMAFVFGLELGFHQVDEGAEEHPRWREYGSIERSTYGMLGTSNGPWGL